MDLKIIVQVENANLTVLTNRPAWQELGLTNRLAWHELDLTYILDLARVSPDQQASLAVVRPD